LFEGKRMMTLFEELQKRELVAQATHPEEVERALNNEKITFYVGFDATADSLHVGGLLQLITAKRLQEAGHRPILLLGGATTKIGDPTGKDDVRKMLSDEDISHNIECIKKQFEKFVDFSDDKALIVNNADWTDKMSAYDFMRLGFHFNINDILRMECYATRRESGGLTLGEMCYLPMQSMDFAHLYDKYGCRMQTGGNDQWSNIIGGVELIRKTRGEEGKSGSVFGMTFNLLTTSDGRKMGKTEKGAVWLDSEKCSVFDFYQYFRNVADEDVIRCLKMLTFLPLSAIEKYESYKFEELNEVKEIFAFELTKLVHSEAEAIEAQNKAKSVFSGGDDAPETRIEIDDDTNILDFLVLANLAPSKGEARRLVQGGGVSLDGEKIDDVWYNIEKSRGEVLIKKGKKVFVKVIW